MDHEDHRLHWSDALNRWVMTGEGTKLYVPSASFQREIRNALVAAGVDPKTATFAELLIAQKTVGDPAYWETIEDQAVSRFPKSEVRDADAQP